MPETVICPRCDLAHPPTTIPDELIDVAEKRRLELEDCLSRQATAMRVLLGNVGKRGSCDGPNCGRTIYWVTHYNGKAVPYTEAGLNHFVDCPDRERFKRPK